MTCFILVQQEIRQFFSKNKQQTKEEINMLAQGFLNFTDFSEIASEKNPKIKE